MANRREQLFAFGMLCTDTKRGRFFWGLDWAARRCSHRFCVATADVRTRKFHRFPCDPHADCDERSLHPELVLGQVAVSIRYECDSHLVSRLRGSGLPMGVDKSSNQGLTRVTAMH
jgi:hypothetical protein